MDFSRPTDFHIDCLLAEDNQNGGLISELSSRRRNDRQKVFTDVRRKRPGNSKCCVGGVGVVVMVSLIDN